MISEEFFENRFQIFDISESVSDVQLNNRIWEYEGGINGDYHLSEQDSFYSTQDSWLLSLHYEIAMQFVETSFSKYTIEKRRLWEGVNKDSSVWHNDLKEGPNCFFLLYFSNLEHLKEGAIYFKNKCQKWSFYPSVGKLLAVNCVPEFMHKADQTKHERIVASFYFNLDHGTYNKTYGKV